MYRKAIYPGTFDPITLGHINIIKRSIKIFDKIIIAIAKNQNKNTLFNLQERIKLTKKATNKIKNLKIIGFNNLIIDCVKKYKTNILIRGLRNINDFIKEQQMAYINKNLSPKLENIFLMSSKKFNYISSSLIKEIIKLKGDMKNFIPKIIYKDIINKLNNKLKN
ncbi:pantetheine-phosphate adenylyltransferase [Candidatus Purcelliella pentastirinorum]|uniref:Phosphopantetheine adenylyltransferase n=1 Tax=Candidatus Purcelliella pentastirinorum TaxID=472834 RepID=A0AAX3N7Z1_9ENTR|nr:pantetheine-phosphate adenylyltransferase [Candidatus Purcelliella pentastirinorum]WDI78751.1 pantetheine-phosphate adenylyltransferase [Candidatus Purcelliella pentastirinorum]WDR80730.1 pantetheine-phosphate adenylyltransferase [Candidatus Purcelliella pentastirinorum]